MKRYLPFAIIAAVAALTIIASAMLYQAKKPLPLSTASAPPPPMEKSVPVENSMLAGKSILEMTGDPEKEHVRGGAQAPVTLEVFGDFQCPSCATASSAISKLEQDYGPRLRVVYRQFPLSMHAHAMDAALAAEAAGLQGHFWEMHDMLYQYQSVWSKAADPRMLFQIYARNLGLDVDRFKEDSTSDEVRMRVISEGHEGVARGVKNTPTLFVNGQQVLFFPPDRLREAIDAALAGHKGS